MNLPDPKAYKSADELLAALKAQRQVADEEPLPFVIKKPDLAQSPGPWTMILAQWTRAMSRSTDGPIMAYLLDANGKTVCTFGNSSDAYYVLWCLARIIQLELELYTIKYESRKKSQTQNNP